MSNGTVKYAWVLEQADKTLHTRTGQRCNTGKNMRLPLSDDF